MNYKHDRESVINKGMKLFWFNGYHNLGMDKICKETGMTKGAFYNSFKGKENFLLVVIEAYGNLIASHLQTHLSDIHIPPIDRLTNLYTNMLVAQPESKYRGCLVNNMMSEMGALNPVVAEVTSAQFERFVNIIEPTVSQAQQEGALDKSLNSKLMTEIIHTTFFGVLTRAKSTKTLHISIIKDLLNLIKNKSDGRKKN
ncbi:MAG: TetR/AcrR family transcriptional regulator [Cytophagales bacterium]|nr:TetR/AcrR family transcriptional regulator [Cytophagales bacterium]